MIVISDGSNPGSIPPRMLTTLERKTLVKKMNSPMMYSYPSLEALIFELKMRSHIVEAAKAMYASGVSFATFRTSRCNEQYWTRTPEGGFLLKPGVAPSVAVNDIFANGHLYGFECAGAIIIILYKAVLDTIGEAAFNRHFRNLYLISWETDRDLQLKATYNLNETYYGDTMYFKNPDYDRSTPEWQGENAVLLDDNLFFGHGIGIGSAGDMIEKLNRARMPGSMTSAYLDNLILTPNFEFVRQLTYREEAGVL
ncbi:protein-glutamine gamma-glutamyltransferase [Paenibacillus sp. LHD-117]|uniref:protein-glutamine gamma-glutamyltransferase n=1 Tax=Paenibacillus sp. LHD-117 TaxID=3071412 RepID=UPI0027DFEE95|nr:protein-glutamine gamma-glutamyltransferase [Paenibacillus sp. LHD-117]MDQ6423340.1 protein-glutamine gamma-glutamyltransferase [Paenibacillus sp. LHD-117]